MSYIVLIFCPSKLVIDNILSSNNFIEVIVISCGYFIILKLFTYKKQIIKLYKFELGISIFYNCGEQSNTLIYVSHINLCAFLYVLGLQDITTRLKQFQNSVS